MDWRLIFLINLPVGVLVLVLAATQVPATPREPSAAVPDFLSAGIFAVGIGALALALVRAPEWGWASGRVLGLLLVAVVLVAVVAARSRRHPAPLVSPALLRVRTFRWSVVSTLVYSVAFGANLLVGVLWLQQVWGWSPLLTGLAIAPGPALVPVTVWLTHRYAPSLSAPTAIGVGSLLMAFGVALRTLSMGETAHYATDFLPGWMIAGVGVGLALPHLMSAATHDLPADLERDGQRRGDDVPAARSRARHEHAVRAGRQRRRRRRRTRLPSDLVGLRRRPPAHRGPDAADPAPPHPRPGSRSSARGSRLSHDVIRPGRHSDQVV